MANEVFGFIPSDAAVGNREAELEILRFAGRLAARLKEAFEHKACYYSATPANLVGDVKKSLLLTLVLSLLKAYHACGF